MHRCLQIPEIALEIVQWLPLTLSDRCMMIGCAFIPGENKTEGLVDREDALAFALTCKTFLNPGLDALWYHMDSIQPLAMCVLPEDFEDVEVWMNTSPQPVTPSGVERLKFYTRRIRILSVRDDDLSALGYRLLSACVTALRPPMLPNLRRLFWMNTKMTTFPYLSLFASPLLEILKILPFSWDSSNDETLFSIISNFAANSPSLADVHIEDPNMYYDWRCCRQTVLVLSALPFLKNIVIDTNISTEMLCSLAGMRRLEYLELNFGECEFPLLNKDLQTRLGNGFSALESLNVFGAELDDLAILLQSFRQRANKIQDVEVTETECSDAAAIHRYITSVCRACSPDTLTCFRLFGGDDAMHQDLSPSPLDNAVFFPLLEFRNMKHFCISACEPSWNDELLGAFASAWPNLLDIDLKAHKTDALTTSIGGLVPFAKHCPQINYIRIQFVPWGSHSIIRPPKWDCGDRSGAPPLCIVLRYPRSELEPEAVSYLEEVFPNLEEISVNKYPQ